jgi:flagellin-like protein
MAHQNDVPRLYLLNRRFSRRGVSQVIAALLLIAIAVAAAVLLYVFAIGLLGSLASSGGQQTKQQVIMEAYFFSGSALTISVRNVGAATVDMSGADYFLNGVSATPDNGCMLTLTISGSCTTTLTVTTTNLSSGAGYPLKIITPEGGVFSYSVIYGGSG